MKRIILILILCLASCVNVSNKGMTALGTNMDSVIYSNGTVNFSAAKIDNATAFGKTTDVINKYISWWGWSNVTKSVSDAAKSISTKVLDHDVEIKKLETQP